ncbi:78866956-03b7-4ed5-a17a-431c2388fec2 [Thermothielavioides terrestris]|uniref:Ataxin-10 homolog n=1 Tax=Thermothielavioides terrestris TaxID=2587410 RepID=A0A446BL25_9PEZI|nr:78866956-03b7-4ed5-a17a-431c2388fec2 [Thermothielavioides terrestris]
MVSTASPAEAAPPAAATPHRPLSIEELCFTSAMSCFEGWLKLDPAIGPRTMAYVTKFISRTLEKTHNLKDVREVLSKSVEVWIWLTRDFAAAIPSLTTRSIGPLASLNDPDKGVTPLESTALITKNYPSLKEDLQLLIKLMHIARNLLVVPEPEIPQDLCAAAQFDQMLYQTIILCINVTSKAYDGDVLEEAARLKLSEITELYKKLLVTCLQQAHNWIAKNDRNKMAFWSTVLFDDDALADEPDGNVYGDFRPDVAKTEVQNWFERNSRFCDKARQLLTEYENNVASKGSPPGHLPCISPLAWNWLPEGTVRVRADDVADDAKITPQWKEDEPDKFEQDKAYGRVSREIDTWWLKTRDPNYDEWVVPMPTVEFAQQRTENCKANLVNRYAHSYRTAEHEGSVHSAEGASLPGGVADQEGKDGGHYVHEYNDDMIEEEDIDDDDSYGEGPMNGLLTEVPNILDPKQIEALHMIVKSCILDNAGLALSRAGENLQKTRCRMFLALECGRSLLREILVFIAVWEKSEQSLIFQLTTQIVEAIHHSALVPYAWQSLRIPKDIISPAQTVLLRLVNNMFRARNNDPPPADSKEHLRDVKLLHFLFIQFRSRIVPECAALMHLQAQIRNELCDPADFPVDSWDMERAKDGIQQFLELLNTVIEVPETRRYLIEWEATYELLTLLKGLEAGVPKKPMVDPANSAAHRQQQAQHAARHDDHDQGYDSEDHPLAPPPPLEEPAHKYPWAGIKGQILHILAGLLQPPPGRSSPGNPEVQSQFLRHNGIISLLNCCVYDDHNRYARERVQICLKWLMDGSEEANKYLRELIATSPPPNLRPPQAGDGQTPPTTSLRIDGIAGEVKVRLRAPGEAAPPKPAVPSSSSAGAGRALPPLASAAAVAAAVADIDSKLGNTHDSRNTLPPIQAGAGSGTASSATMPPRSRPEELLRDIITLADEAARLAMGRRLDADETEEEEGEEEDFM